MKKKENLEIQYFFVGSWLMASCEETLFRNYFQKQRKLTDYNENRGAEKLDLIWADISWIEQATSDRCQIVGSSILKDRER